MHWLTNSSLAVFLVSFIVLYASEKLGTRLAHHIEGIREDFEIILTATLTLLGLLIGFSFSMAISHYDQRKFNEERETNAIDTQYARAELFPASDVANIRRLLRDYLDQRILFYQVHDRETLKTINASTAQLQRELWAAVLSAALPQQTPITALAVSGMNDVLNTENSTQAAWFNRIPVAAWMLLALIAISANIMVGLSFRRGHIIGKVIAILPAIISISLFLLADIDFPRGGVIRDKASPFL